MAIPNTKENQDKCICPDCPTFDGCAKEKNEILYCAVGKSACQLERKGCICGDCPVFKECQLKDYYFCLEGAAK